MKRLFLLLYITTFVTSAYGHGISLEQQEAMLNGGNLQYLWLGTEHMLTGYDHLLFLFGVLFYLNKFKDIVKFVTIFTLGHSVTLLLATFLGITANYYLVDAVIALSIIYKGFDNNRGFENYLSIPAPNASMMVLLFGLIHGFGLSTRLQQLPLGTQDMDMFLRIVSFNIGVELGQIVALIPMLILLKLWRKRASFSLYAKVTNDALMLLGFMLLLMQLHGYLHTKYPHEFGFNHDEHLHIHMEMKKKKKEYSHGTL